MAARSWLPLAGLARRFSLPVGAAPSAALAPRVALLALVVVSGLLRLAWCAALEPTNDEAYHFLYSQHLALSYFDHPPMTAWVETVGLTLCGGWVHPLSLRLGFIAMFAGATVVLYRWTARFFGEWAGFYSALFLNLSGYYAIAGGFALPDSPYLFFSLLTMWAASEAVLGEPKRLLPWVWVGLAFGAAFLSKYHAVFLPAGVVLYAILTPGARRLLWSPGPYLAVLIGFAMFSPVILWNAENGWASFRFQGGRAVGAGFRPEGLVAAFVGPIGYLLPWVWALMVGVLAANLRRFRSQSGPERLMVLWSLIPMTAFTAVACVRWVLPHWPLIGFVPLYPLIGKVWADYAAGNPERSRTWLKRMAVALVVIVAFALVQARFGIVTFPGKDPIADASGWTSVERELAARGLLDDPKTFLVTTRWFDSGQLAFAVRDRIPVLCYNAADARGFAFWSKPEQWVGWNGLLVSTTPADEKEIELLSLFFEKVQPVAEFSMTRGGTPFRPVKVWRLEKQKVGFPFTYPTK